MRTKDLSVILFIVATILLIPLLAMQFTNEVNWSGSDFLVMGSLLFVSGLALQFVRYRLKTRKSRIIASSAILLVLFIIWAELAVGILGTPFAGS
ncbi:hypothetical protein [Christiangramia sp. OXR-203]|jgi:uncharacterized membrane protein YhhN|uniref:hypothetical protein n=1 Tax=Christiangramia sp. OXR-203 TaxID=3100176 RepID=UPI002AC9B38A|nr:hypothetical protein [Christiangramia sp. OXR-203]WPY99319.1 hypothetical protein T8I65_03690 [Christiangramia sp. OXR-203]